MYPAEYKIILLKNLMLQKCDHFERVVFVSIVRGDWQSTWRGLIIHMETNNSQEAITYCQSRGGLTIDMGGHKWLTWRWLTVTFCALWKVDCRSSHIGLSCPTISVQISGLQLVSANDDKIQENNTHTHYLKRNAVPRSFVLFSLPFLEFVSLIF